MSGRKGQEHLSTYVPTQVASVFRDWARQTDGNTAGALRRLIEQVVEGVSPEPGVPGESPARTGVVRRAAGQGRQIGFRLHPTERAALDGAARSYGTSPANWVRSLVLVHLARHPEWHPAERDALREVSHALRGINNGLTHIAQVLQDAVRTGAYPPGEGLAAQKAAEIVQNEMRRMTAVITGNYAYWGLPEAERPTAARGVVKRTATALKSAEAQRKSRPKRRPGRFTDDG